jgi:hypothetical protein
VVRWKAGELPDIVDQAEAALMDSGLQIFQRDRMLVRVTKRGVPSIRNYKRDPGMLGMVVVDSPYLVEALTRSAVWEKFDSRTDKWRRANAPEQVASTYIARSGQWNVPRLWDLITTPTLRPDGTILQTPGYDAPTHVYYDPCGTKFPEIPDKPTADQAREAFKLLKEAFGSFPYNSEVDRSVALAAVLTAVVRRYLPSAPLVAISAPVPASGKTLLSDCVALLVTGAPAPAMTFAETDEEAKKTALAVLMEGDPVVLIDNVERPLSGDWLCSILTSEIYKQRMLGKTEMISVPTRTLFLATGNNIQIAGDMRSRSLLCRLDPKTERPEQREFNYDLRDRLLAQRPQLVAAALTLMRGFVVSGKSIAEVGCKQWGRFERWTEMVRAPLMWMDCEDPCDSLKTIEQQDPTRGDHLAVLECWAKEFKDKPITLREALEYLHLGEPTDAGKRLLELFHDLGDDRHGKISTRRMGKWFEKRTLVRVGGYQIERGGDEGHAATWKVTKVK